MADLTGAFACDADRPPYRGGGRGGGGDSDGGGDERGDDRAQLVLVAGLALAVVLVALVLLTNTAIYTENLATRDNGVGERDALGYRASVVDGVGGIVDRENAAEYDDPADVRENVSDGVAELDVALRGSAARSAASARVNRSAATYVEGVLVRHRNDSREFTSAAETADWTIAYDTNRTRAFAATVERSSLASTNDSALDGAFTVEVAANSSADTWAAFVYRNQSTGDIAVATSPAGGTGATEVCSVDAPNATVGFTTGTLAGEECPGLDWREGIDSSYDLSFRNGTNAAGTYDMTVRGTTGLLNLVTLNDGTVTDDPDSPYHVPAVYAVEVPIRYETNELTYRADVRVAPGEHDD
ncbi:hypothetical protein Hbl1158_08045 [Halobaculum sp. CBA1158]|uniref:DUF7261 family protein n=1 Tax=Halobaculum sp. CBA1158 TaxID=2904243 RepID=UPI001F1A2408|nr:hypothetical protein [Halobaculum sp. CBA1158]UIO98514.1 hypothetical protein Hbl1158_08045 [Halobaculum sp. CBA1158]